MRAHKLLSPHRGRQGAARVHAGTIVTQAPNVMWGTDGVRVFTLDDGTYRSSSTYDKYVQACGLFILTGSDSRKTARPERKLRG